MRLRAPLGPLAAAAAVLALVVAPAAHSDDWRSAEAPLDPISTDGATRSAPPPGAWKDGETWRSEPVRRPSRATAPHKRAGDDRPKSIYELVLPAMNAPERVTQDAYTGRWSGAESAPKRPSRARAAARTSPPAQATAAPKTPAADPPSTIEAAPAPAAVATAPAEPAAAPPPATAAAPPPLEYVDRYATIEQIWERHRDGILTANLDATAEAARQIRAVMTASGIRGLPTYATVILRTAGREAEAGNIATARELATLATDLAPTTPETWLALARYRLRGPNEDVGLAFGALHMAARAALGSPAHLAGIVGTLVGALLAALLAVIAVVLLAPCARAALVYHELAGERLPRSVSPGVRALLVGAVFLAPLVAPGGIGWFLFAALLLATPVMSRRERMGFVALVLVLAAAAPIVRLRASFDAYPDDPALQALAEADAGVLTERSLERTDRALADPGERGPLLAARALTLKRIGDLAAAAEVFESAATLAYGDGSVHNNRANVLAALGRFDEAEAAYAEAARLAPREGAIPFNLGQLHARRGKAAESEAAMRLARSLDPTLVGLATGPQPAIDLPGDPKRWWGRLLAETPARNDAAAALWERLFPWVPLWCAPILAALAAVAILAPIALRRDGFARLCDRCGAIVRATVGDDDGGNCASCRALASQSAQLAPELRTRQLGRIERFQALKRRTLAWVPFAVPGFDHLLRGRAVRGIVVLTALFGLIALWSGAGGYAFSPVYIPATRSGLAIAMTAFALVAIYYAGLPRRRKGSHR